MRFPTSHTDSRVRLGGGLHALDSCLRASTPPLTLNVRSQPSLMDSVSSSALLLCPVRTLNVYLVRFHEWHDNILPTRHCGIVHLQGYVLTWLNVPAGFLPWSETSCHMSCFLETSRLDTIYGSLLYWQQIKQVRMRPWWRKWWWFSSLAIPLMNYHAYIPPLGHSLGSFQVIPLGSLFIMHSAFIIMQIYLYMFEWNIYLLKANYLLQGLRFLHCMPVFDRVLSCTLKYLKCILLSMYSCNVMIICPGHTLAWYLCILGFPNKCIYYLVLWHDTYNLAMFSAFTELLPWDPVSTLPIFSGSITSHLASVGIWLPQKIF